MIDIYSALGYFTGLYFIQPEMEPSTLVTTAFVIHLLDALVCYVMATQSGRNKTLWTIAGLLLGVWALGTLFLFAEKEIGNQRQLEE